MLELVVAMAVLVSAMLPLAYSFAKEARLARWNYYRALAIEIVDGEMEVLLAGEWREHEPGSRPYRVTADAAANLPGQNFVITLKGDLLRLEWIPPKSEKAFHVVREARVR